MPCLHCISWREALTPHSFCIQMRHAWVHQVRTGSSKRSSCFLFVNFLSYFWNMNLWGCLIKDFLCSSPYLIANSAEVVCFLWDLSLRVVVHSLFMWHVFFKLQAAREEPIHILNVAIKTDGDVDDDGLAAMFREFTQSKVSQLSSLPLWSRLAVQDRSVCFGKSLCFSDVFSINKCNSCILNFCHLKSYHFTVWVSLPLSEASKVDTENHAALILVCSTSWSILILHLRTFNFW